MVTIKIKENSKQAKAFLEFIRGLSFVEFVESTVSTKEQTLTVKQKKWIAGLKKIKSDVKSGTFKGQSAQSFLDEL